MLLEIFFRPSEIDKNSRVRARMDFPGFGPALLREALLTFVGAAKLMFPFFFFVRKIIDFCEGYMNPWHMLQSIGTLKTRFLQIPRKVKLRLKAGLFGDPVLTLFFEKRCKNVPIEIIVSAAWKWPSTEWPALWRTRQRILKFPYEVDSIGDSRFPALQGIV